MNTSCKLLVYYPDDFRIFSGNLSDGGRMSAKFSGVSIEDMEGSVCMKLKWYEENIPHLASVKITSSAGEDLTFEIISEAVSEKEDGHFIEFRDYFEMVKAEDSKLSEYKYRVDKINNRFRSALSTQIKKIITDEELTNQYLFRMLMQIDSKMDELLDALKQDEVIEGLRERKLYSLGGGGLSFRNDKKDISAGDILYVQSMPKNGAGINFAALCRVSEVIPAGESQICEAVFEYLDVTTRESIIHYIFQRDREQLKRKRN